MLPELMLVAATSQPDVTPLESIAWCGDSKEVIGELMQVFGEEPAVTGKGRIFTGIEPIRGTWTIWINPNENTFTTTVTLDERPEITCITATGHSLKATEY